MKRFRLYNEQTEAIVQRCSVKKAPSKILQKPQEKNSSQNFSFHKAASLSLVTLLKKKPRHRRSPVNPAKPPRRPTSSENLRWLLTNRSKKC